MSPRRSIPTKKEPSGLPTWVIIAGVIIVVVVGILAVTQIVDNMQPAPQAAAPTSVVGGITRNGRTEGNPNATIKLVEYSDFQ